MTDEFAQILSLFNEYATPRRWRHTDPFRLACSLEGPASEHDIDVAWAGVDVPSAARQLWRAAASARLFEDIDYGQWGLALLSPIAASERTDAAVLNRPEDFSNDDVVIGEFLGDTELLVITGTGEMLVALPLDGRGEWRRPASSLSEFLSRYRESLGDKYWE